MIQQKKGSDIRFVFLYIGLLGLLTFLLAILFNPHVLGLFSEDRDLASRTLLHIASVRKIFLVAGISMMISNILLIWSTFRRTINPASRSINRLLMLVSIVWLLFVIETVLRIVPRYTSAQINSRSLHYEPSPLSIFKIDTSKAEILAETPDSEIVQRRLSHGFTGARFSLKKADGAVRIFIMGGSQVYDMNASMGKDWPHLVQLKLHALGLRQVEIINAGVPNYRTFDQIGRLLGEIYLYKPDYIILDNTYNDIQYFHWLSPERPAIHGLAPISRDSRLNPGPIGRLLENSQLYLLMRDYFFNLYNKKIKTSDQNYVLKMETTAAKENIPISQYALEQYRINLQTFISICQEIGAIPILVTEPRFVTGSNLEELHKRGWDQVSIGLKSEEIPVAFGKCDSTIRSTAERNRIPFCDLSMECTGKAVLFNDIIHFNARGSEQAADVVSRFIYRLLNHKKQE